MFWNIFRLKKTMSWQEDNKGSLSNLLVTAKMLPYHCGQFNIVFFLFQLNNVCTQPTWSIIILLGWTKKVNSFLKSFVFLFSFFLFEALQYKQLLLIVITFWF